jgi:hypothetical protein
MNAPHQFPPMDPWAPGVHATDVRIAERGDPNPLSGEPTAADDGIGNRKIHVPQITLITKRDAPSLMSKRISLDADGKLKSDGSGCSMVTGIAERASVETAGDLARIIQSCGSNQAIALGALKAELLASAAVTIPKRLDKHPGAIARSRSYIDYRPGVPAWCLIDFDTKGMPEEVKAKIDAAGGMWEALLAVAPELANAARVSRASTSAGLYRSDTDEPVPGSNGMHHYLLVHDGGDIERFLKDLHDRCWLHGFGWHLIGGAGQLLDRSIVDRMVAFGERLCFEGAPDIVPPLAQDEAMRMPVAIEGSSIRSDHAVLPLSENERYRVNEAKENSKKALGQTATKVRDKHDKELAERISANSGTPIATALRLVRARHDGVLYSDIKLEFDHLDIATVGTVMANADRFVGETLADPLEGVEYGRCKAKVMRGDDGSLFIHSFAHGRYIYQLRHDLKSAKAAFEQVAGGGVDAAIAIMAQAELEDDEFDDFVKSVSDKANVGIRAVRARFKKERASARKWQNGSTPDGTREKWGAPDEELVDPAAVGADDVARLNKAHAVLPIGGKTRVVTFGELDEFPGRETIVMTQSVSDFVLLNNKYRHFYLDNGELKSEPMGDHWIGSQRRRQYDGGMAFMPQHDGDVGNKLNLWRGFGVKAVKGDCSKFLDFMRDIVCGGDETNFDYLRKREASILQKRVRTEVALGLQTKEEGCGKGFYEKTMRRLTGHAMQLANPKHIVGAFNPHLEPLLRLTADEALFVGSPEHRNALFNLITEPEMTIEPKNCGIYSAPSYLNMTILSNSDHFLPVSDTARRFFIPTMSAARKQDFGYFTALQKELDNGGYEALLYHLLHEVDLTDFNVRAVPQTEGLRRQRDQGLPPLDAWWCELLETGTLWGADPKEPRKAVSNSYDRMIKIEGQIRQVKQLGLYDQARRIEPRLRIFTNDRRLGTFLSEMGCENGQKVLRRQGWTFPPLEECRAAWIKRYPGWKWRNPDITEWRAEDVEVIDEADISF